MSSWMVCYILVCLYGISVAADAVRRNPATCRAVDADVVETIENWLRFAKDHEDGRQRRAAGARAAN